MKYTSAIDINLPLNRVIELFNNPDNLKYWMPELISSELISGTLGKTGAVGKLRFKDGNKEYEMIETVTTKNLPSIFARTYELKNIFITIKDSFIPITDNKTRYISENEVALSGMLKCVAFILKAKFKMRTKKQLSSFKDFAENRL